MSQTRLLILDANVLIDFSKVDPSILSLISKYIGQVYVPTPILEEVRQLDEDFCASLGLVLVEPTLEQLMQANMTRSSLSFQDHLCLLLAKANGWVCITNDGRLRRECNNEGVELIWGIESICILVEKGALPVQDAQFIIQEIHKMNAKYITIDIVQRAFRRIGI